MLPLSRWPWLSFVALALLTCSPSGAEVAAPDPTITALEARVAALSSELERLQPTPAFDSTQLGSESSIALAEVEPTPAPTIAVPPGFPTRAPRVLTAADAAPCQLGQIKGNRNTKIYHVPGGGSYSQTKANVQCFTTESEAQAAGYRRALN